MAAVAPLFARGVQKIVAVAVPAANRDEQIAGRDFAAVVRDSRRLIRKIVARRYEQTSLGERGFYFLDAHRIRLASSLDACSHSRGRLS